MLGRKHATLPARWNRMIRLSVLRLWSAVHAPQHQAHVERLYSFWTNNCHWNVSFTCGSSDEEEFDDNVSLTTFCMGGPKSLSTPQSESTTANSQTLQVTSLESITSAIATPLNSRWLRSALLKKDPARALLDSNDPRRVVNHLCLNGYWTGSGNIAEERPNRSTCTWHLPFSQDLPKTLSCLSRKLASSAVHALLQSILTPLRAFQLW